MRDDDDDDDDLAGDDSRLGTNRYRDELEELRTRNERLEQRLSAQEWRNVQERKRELERAFDAQEYVERQAEEVMARAIAEANGSDVTVAMRARDEAIEKKRQIAEQYRYEESQTAQANQPKQKNDPVVMRHAKKWVESHPWYDVNGRNDDSRTVLEIDNNLAAEGYVPRTELYWKELEKRVRRNLPHRFEADGDSSSGRANNKKTVYISRERKEALIEAGVWDDPKLRQKYVKQFQIWDRENAE